MVIIEAQEVKDEEEDVPTLEEVVSIISIIDLT